jgi:hypothetical protein
MDEWGVGRLEIDHQLAATMAFGALAAVSILR